MKIINVRVDGNIKIVDIFDTCTQTSETVGSSLKIPTGNYKDIIFKFDFVCPLADDLHLLAMFKASFLEKPIEVEITDIEAEGETYQTSCFIPGEVLQEIGIVELGIYGYNLNEDETLKKRISLEPIVSSVIKGSYNENAVVEITPTPTVFEVYFDKVKKANEQIQENLKQYENDINELFDNANENLKKIKHFNSVAEMKACTTLIETYVVMTLGYYEANDGGGATYLIREKINNDVEDNKNIIFLNNNLVAEQIKESTLKFHTVSKSSATYIVEFPNGKNMIIDTGMETQWTDIKNCIDNLGITKFDYMIITHFHSDHTGNIQNLINNYDFTNCTCWVGMKPDFINHSNEIDETESTYDDTILLIKNLGLMPVVPNNDSYIEIDKNTKLHFLNTSSEVAENYYGAYTEWRTEQKLNFNHFSLITEIIHKEVVILSTGDIERPVEEQYFNYMRKCHVMTVPHHATNRDAYKPFYYATMPEFAIAMYQTDGDEWVKNEYKSFMYLKNLNSKIITARWSNSVNGLFTFISDGTSVNTNVLGSGINNNLCENPYVYSKVEQLINYTSQQPDTLRLTDLLNNMIRGSIFIGNRTSIFEERYPLLYADIQEIFKDNFNIGFNIEIYKGDMNADNNYIKIFSGNKEFIAHKTYQTWTLSGNGLFGDVTGINNLIAKLKTLPVGNYMLNYTDDIGNVLSTNGAYMLDITIINNDFNNNLQAKVDGVLRHTGGNNNSIARVVTGYINTTSSPQYVWHKVNSNPNVLPTEIQGIDNLINNLKLLEIGHYYCSYKDDIQTVLTNGFYNLSIDIVTKNNNDITASIIGVLRNTGGTGNNVARVVAGYINTTSAPKYVWHQINN